MRFNDLVFAFPALLSAVMITAIFGPGADQRHHRHRHLQHPGLRPRRPRRRAGDLAARIHPGRPRRRQGQGADHDRAHPAQHREPAAGAGHDPVRARHPGRGRPLLCRARRAAADAELGPHAVRRADAHDRRAVAGALSRPRHRHHRARPQPARRRRQRRARPETEAAAMSLLEIENLSLSRSAARRS